MIDFLRLAAYAFLALVGLWAWATRVEGWRYYFGIGLFILGTMRILTILRQRIQRARFGAGKKPGHPHGALNSRSGTDSPSSSHPQ